VSLLSRATATTRERHRNDFYRTIDVRAVAALMPHVPPGTLFLEPCAGDGSLIAMLEAAGLHCYGRFDLAPACPYRDLYTDDEPIMSERKSRWSDFVDRLFG
jgi:tRNA G10  N-methylase Trm11